MNIKQKEYDEILELVLKGELDAGGANVLKKVLEECKEQEKTKIILNLKGIKFINSVGLALIVDEARQFEKFKGYIKLLNISDSVTKILNLTGLIRYFSIYTSRKDALK